MNDVLAPAIRRGDHAACVFAADDDQARLVGRVAHDAFARGDRVFFLADRADESDVVAFLDDAGLDGRARLDSGELQFMHSSQLGFEDGFEKELQLGAWEALTRQAVDDGYGGLAALAEMSWALSWRVPTESLVAFEAAAAPLFASRRLAAVCQYDARLFDGATAARAAHVHPLGVAMAHDGCTIDHGRLRIERSGDRLAFGGEVDLATVDLLRAQLREHLANGDAVADCGEVTFIDVTGCRLLRDAAVGSIGNGRLTLENVPPAIARVLTLCRWADVVR